MKKKKIRKIREMVKSEQENLDVKILDELFTYLEVYEKNCQTLINSDSRNKTDGNEEKNINKKDLFHKRSLTR